MSARYEIWLCMPTGEQIEPLQWNRIRYTRAVNDVGMCEVWLPSDYDLNRLGIDYRIDIWRAPEWASAELQRWYYIRKIVANEETIRVIGVDPIDLLRRRIVYYEYDPAGAQVSEITADTIAGFLWECAHTLVYDAGLAYRDLSSYGVRRSGPQVPIGYSLPTIHYQAMWRNALFVAQEVCKRSLGTDVPVYFDFECVPPKTLDFRIYYGLRGVDRTGDGFPVFSYEAGLLDNPELTLDYSNEVTVVFAGGSGTGTSRIVREQYDADRITRSPFGRIEAFLDMRSESSTDVLDDHAKQELEAARPRISLAATIRDAPGSRYGVDWALGDRLKIAYRGYVFEADVKKVDIVVDEDGEQISGTIEGA